VTRKITAVITLATLFSTLFVSCVRRIPVQLYETGQLRHDRINGVVDNSGVQRLFSGSGGEFHLATNEICGVTDDNSQVCSRLDDVDSVLVVARAQGQALSTSIPSDGFVSYLKPKKPSEISGVITTDGVQHTFSWSGAKIDPPSQILNGYAPDGSPLQVSLSDIDHVIVQKPDYVANTLLGIGVLGAFTALFVGLALQAEFGGW